MRRIDTAESVSYGGAVIAFLSGLTLNELAALVGIVTALATAAFSIWYNWRRDVREEKRRAEEAAEHQLRLRQLSERCGDGR